MTKVHSTTHIFIRDTSYGTHFLLDFVGDSLDPGTFKVIAAFISD